MEEFIYNLNSKNIISTSYFTDNKISGLSNFSKALIFIIPAAYFLYKYFFKNERKEFKSLNEVSNHINEQEKSSAFSSIVQGIIFILFSLFCLPFLVLVLLDDKRKEHFMQGFVPALIGEKDE